MCPSHQALTDYNDPDDWEPTQTIWEQMVQHWTDCQQMTSSPLRPRVLFFRAPAPSSLLFLFFFFAVTSPEEFASAFAVTCKVPKTPRTRLISTTDFDSGSLSVLADLLLTPATCWLKSVSPGGLISRLFSLQSLMPLCSGRDHINCCIKSNQTNVFWNDTLTCPSGTEAGNECLIIPPSPRCWCNLIATKHVSHSLWKGGSVEQVADSLTIIFYPGERGRLWWLKFA